MNLITRSLLLSAITLLPFLVFGQTRYYVKVDAVGGEDGSSWDNAYTDLQDALAVSVYGDSIWVAAGTYFPTDGTNREISFELKNGVKMYGGFAGSELLLPERNWIANKTILSGDIGSVNDSLDNSYTVVYMEHVDSTTFLDGFTVTKGRTIDASFPIPSLDRKMSGAGLYIQATNALNEVNPKIANCTFTNNFAATFGGGVFVNGSNGGAISPSFTNCYFAENSTGKYQIGGTGSGICLKGGSDNSAWKLISCSFFHNVSTNGIGGAVSIILEHGVNDVYFEECEFENNSSTSSGGAINIDQLNENELISIHLQNCKFDSNTSPQGAGVSYSGFSANLFIDNSKFTNNSSVNGIITIIGKSLVHFTNSIFQKNRSNNGCIFLIGGNFQAINSIFLENMGTLIELSALTEFLNSLISNCTFFENKKKLGVPYLGLCAVDGTAFGANLNLYNSIFLNNEKNSSMKLIRLQNSSAAIDNSMFDIDECSEITNASFTCGPGNLFNLAPLFLDTAAHDYRLHPCSPARNAGSNAAAQAAGLLTDIAGLPRIQEGTVDMGAHESPAFTIASATLTSPPCTVGSLGTVELALDWGCPPFFLSWSEAASGAGGTGMSGTAPATLQLLPGSYTVTVTDGRMEAATISFDIGQPMPLSAALAATDVDCPVFVGASMGGAATASSLGGTAPFSFNWHNGQTTATATDLPAGTASVTITDANGCTATSSVEIGTAGSLQVGVNVINPIFCHGEQDGEVEVQPLGGTPPFAYQWEGLPQDQSPSLDSIGPGSYSATVTDALGCTGDVQFTLNDPMPVSVGVALEQPACNGGLATANASATGGTPGFSFQWSNGQASANAMLPPGGHTVTATDVNGCTGTGNVQVIAPPLLTAFVAAMPQILCNGEENGQLTALPQGGTPPYSYGWSGGLPPDSLLASIGPATYTLTLTDANGCTASASTSIAEHLEIVVEDTVINASAPGVADGSITLTSVSGGSGSGYEFAWSNGDNTQNIVNVSPGNYSLTVTDTQGCTANFSFFVDYSSATNLAQANPFGAAIVPNPSGRATGARLQLTSPRNGLIFSIFEGTGKLVAAGKIDAALVELPKNLAAGSYRVVLQDGQRMTMLNWVVGTDSGD